MVDPRGQRCAAAVTGMVLAVVLVTSGGGLLLAQTVAFGIGAVCGLRVAPYTWLFRVLVRPRLGPPAERADETPPRFAQALGATFGAVGTAGFLAGVTALGFVATALAFFAAFFDAAFGLCLGCQSYLAFRSISVKGVTP